MMLNFFFSVFKWNGIKDKMFSRVRSLVYIEFNFVVVVNKQWRNVWKIIK